MVETNVQDITKKTLQELGMLSSVTHDCHDLRFSLEGGGNSGKVRDFTFCLKKIHNGFPMEEVFNF